MATSTSSSTTEHQRRRRFAYAHKHSKRNSGATAPSFESAFQQTNLTQRATLSIPYSNENELPFDLVEIDQPSSFAQSFSSVSFIVIYTVTAVFISLSLFPGLLLYPLSPRWYRAYVRKTEELFALLLVFITEFWSPATDLVVTGDDSVPDLFVASKKPQDGLKLNVPKRVVMISNHQIYADWIYLWCFAYFAKSHGALKIILKDSLKWIPIFGWGMHFFDFIFLSRKWAKDRASLEASMARVTGDDTKDEPMWLLIFPEGTVISKTTRESSQRFAQKMQVDDPAHLLLPRSTGLQFCLERLQPSVPYLYDFTVGYDGLMPIPAEPPASDLDSTFPHEIYTLRGMYFQQKYPRHIHMHVRRFATSDIPIDEERFSAWLRKRWDEKDRLMEAFYRDGHFPASRVGPVSLPIKGENYAPLVATWIGFGPYWNMVRTFLGSYKSAA